MFYFGAFWKPKAFDTFAASRDLVHWTRWEGPHLIEPSEPWDAEFAHKPWVLKHDGVVYHFYCAVGSQGRAIALATSRPMQGAESAGDVTLLDDVGSPAGRICFDFANALPNGRDLCRELQILGKDRVCRIQCTDQDGVWLRDAPVRGAFRRTVSAAWFECRRRL